MFEYQVSRPNVPFLAVLGDPIGHSKSPLMMNHAFQQVGFEANYEALHVLPEQLADAIQWLRSIDFIGANITIPHKVNVMKYIDEIDQHALAIGAVNTLVNHNGYITGYNTDGLGYIHSLQHETATQLSNKHVLLVGAGGAARAIAYEFAQAGVKRIQIANRSVERANELAALIHASCHSICEVEVISLEQIEDVINDQHIVVNLTPIGMTPNVDQTPIPLEWLHSKLIVSDTVYTPLETKLLQLAKQKGAQIHRGLGMFIHQGAIAFEHWTKQKAPIEPMRQIVEQQLQQGV